LSLSCRPRSGAHAGVRPSVCVDCRLALPHAALGLIAIRGILGCPERWPHRNTSGRWFPAPALELAGVPPLNGVAILVVRKKLDAEGWAFLLIMPGLAEELVFRGVYQSLLNRVFGKPWRLAGAGF